MELETIRLDLIYHLSLNKKFTSFSLQFLAYHQAIRAQGKPDRAARCAGAYEQFVDQGRELCQL
jgi:hypothetical protein